MHAGVDEAGRGPVLGPLVVAGVLADPTTLPSGVADSKTLTPAGRAALFEQLTANGSIEYHILRIEASDLSDRMEAGTSLNQIEIEAFQHVLATLGAQRAVVDALGRDTDGLGQRLSDALDGRCQVEARIGADASDPVVGAASILAKVTRDRAMEALASRVKEPVGSGYPSDPVTRAFLTQWRRRTSDWPPQARRTWATLADLGYGNRTLNDFS